jgi:hypothetical protein
MGDRGFEPRTSALSERAPLALWLEARLWNPARTSVKARVGGPRAWPRRSRRSPSTEVPQRQAFEHVPPPVHRKVQANPPFGRRTGQAAALNSVRNAFARNLQEGGTVLYAVLVVIFVLLLAGLFAMRRRRSASR